MGNKKWVTFDLDETLIQNPFSKWVFPELEVTIQNCMGKDIQVTKYLTSEHKKRLENHQYVEAYDWDQILDDFLVEHNMKLNTDIESIVKKYSTYPNVYLLERTILSDLQQLKNKGYHLAAVTNGFYKYQYPVIKALGLADLFDEVITPSEGGYAKPDIKMVDKLCEGGEIVAHIGDRVDHDVCFSNQLNALSILIDSQMPDDIKAVEINSRMEKPEYVKMINDKYPLIDENHHPKVVIHSIAELNDIL